MTYLQARIAILAYLSNLPGWTVKANLKVPQAVSPRGRTLRFKPQAVYVEAHSTFLDIRTMTPERFTTIMVENYDA